MSERARQVVALGAAVGVVLVAVVVRGRLDDGDGGGAGGGGRTLVCSPELAEVCEAAAGEGAEVRVEDPLDTADALVGARDAAELDADLWLVTRPWAEAVEDARARANEEPLLGEPVGPVARSPVGVLVWEDRAAALEAGACGGTVGWRCVGEAADRLWDEVGGQASWGRCERGWRTRRRPAG